MDGLDQERERLAEILAALADGDGAAVFWLAGEFGHRIERVVRRHLRHLGVHHPDPADVQALVLESCLEIQEVAGGWDPEGGALPWNWAERRLRSSVARHVGQHTTSIDDPARPVEIAEADVTEVVHVDRDVDEVLDELAERDHEVAAVHRAVHAVLSERDRRVFLEYRVQQAMDDPSPAHTVGAMHAMTPAAVRQVVSRANRRLAAWFAQHGGPDGLALVA